MTAKVKILEALADASAEDLAEIESEIVKLGRKLASLRAAKSLVDGARKLVAARTWCVEPKGGAE